MSKIVGVIPLQNYELIRNKIAEIIAIELENQFVISYDPDFDCNVWLERTTPFDQTEMTPAVINVSFIDGNYQNEDVKDADGVYSYAVDVYSRGYTNDENIGDTRAALIVQKVIGKIRAILMATVYKTVDTGLGIVKNRRVVSVQVYDPKRHPQGDDSTTFDQAGRLTFQVTAIETVEVLTPNMIQGSDTWVRWCCTDKGYVWINDGQTNGTPGNPHVCPPIPPTPPLGPYLRTVSVDGVTITGDGTPSDPLVAIGGGGGNSILLQTDGVNNGSQSILNLKEGSNITVTDDGSGGVTITASGGGLPQVNSDWNSTSGVSEILNKPIIPTATSELTNDSGFITAAEVPVPNLQEVTDIGNQTTNDIIFDTGVGILLDNGSRLREGTTNANLGGYNGIAQICSASYELKWEAGRLYYMEQNGFTIREVTHNFTFTPAITDDASKGFVIGSRWSLDNGDVYVCSDATNGAAVWALQAAGGVTSVTGSAPLSSSGGATPDISITQSDASTDGYLSSTDWNTFDGKFDVPTGTNADYLDGTGTPTTFPTIPAAQVNSDWNATSGVAEILNKPTIPVVTGFVPYTGATADLDMGTHNVTADHIALNVSPSGAGFVVGATEWNNTIGGSQTLLKGGTVTLKNGVDLVARIVNKVTPNTTLTKAAYQAVRVSGATGGRLSVELARANIDANSADTIGLVCETIATNQEGFIQTVGQLLDINTTGSLQGETWADGDVLYLSPTTAGRITNIKPTGATGHIVVIGYVEYAHANQGAIYIKIMNGWELDELHNVFINSPVNNDALIYESSTQLWKNKTIATALGYTPVSTTRSISTTSPLSGGGDLSADRTLSIADAAADGSTKGAAAFTAADFNAASGVISIDYTNGQAASASNKGFLTSADWTTFNNKGGSTYKSVIDTTPVTGTTTNTKVFAQLVPANTFAIGDIIQIKARLSKVGVAGLMTLRVYVNTADSLTVPAATLISTTVTASNAQLNFAIDKSAAIKSSTVTQTQTATNSALYQDPQTATTALTNSNIDWTVNQYIIFAIQNGAAGDSTVMSHFQIIKQ